MFNVNLVFHGVFAFVLNPKGVEVLVPYFGPHEYLFGSFGDLEPMAKGDLFLKGLIGIDGNQPNPNFSADKGPTVKGHRERCKDNLFSILHLEKYPAAVHYFRPYEKPQDIGGAVIKRFPFGGIHGAGLNPTVLAGPIVFRYTAKALDDVQMVFRKKPLKFTRIPDAQVPSTFNLHFFAEGEKDLPDAGDRDRSPRVSIHYLEAWTRLSSLVAGLDVRLDKIWPFVLGHTQPLPNDTGIPGLPKGHLADLDELHALSVNPESNPFGGDSDCDKAHLVIDNRS